MRRGERPPDDQAEVVFTDTFVAQVGELTDSEALDVLTEVVRLCDDPAGTHPLAAPLAGWNTLDVLSAYKRVVYKASVVRGVGLLEVLCIGPRSDNEVYDMATALVDAGLLDPDEVTDLFDALAVLAVLAEDLGVDGWDYRPTPAPDGMVRAAVASGVLDEATARALSTSELSAAMAGGWSDAGVADPYAALMAALETARDRGRRPVEIDAAAIIASRADDRCGAEMPRARARCIRRQGHPGPHRAR